jgi:O-antigen ligase
LYIFTVVTQRLDLGTAAISVGFAGLFFEGRRVQFAPFLIPFAVFLLWCYVNSGHSYWPSETSRMLGVMSRIGLIAFLVVAVVNDALRLRVFAYVFVASFLIYPVRGALLNYFVVGHTLYGRAIWNYMYENPNDLAALTFFPLALTAWLALTSRGRERLALFGIAGLEVLTVFLTQSRGALVGLVIGLLLFFATRSRGRRLRTLLAAACLGLLVIPFVPDSAWQRFGGMANLTSTETLREADPEGSAQARYNIWRVAARIIAEHPVGGVGFAAYGMAHLKYSVLMGVPRTAAGRRDTHSTYLNVTAETGYVGLSIFLMVLALPLLAAERARRRGRGVAGAELVTLTAVGFVSFMAAGIFGSFTQLNFLYLQLAIITSASMWLLGQSSEVTSRAAMSGMRSSPASGRFADRRRA